MLFLNTLIRNNDTHLTYSSTAERCYVAKISFLFSLEKNPSTWGYKQFARIVHIKTNSNSQRMPKAVRTSFLYAEWHFADQNSFSMKSYVFRATLY